MGDDELAQSRVIYDDEIDLRQLTLEVWAGKWIVAAITIAVALASVAIALSMPNVYVAEARLAPNERSAPGAMASLAAQYGGLAGLAGIDLNAGSVDKTALSIEVLTSRKFLTEFVERRSILVPLMASAGWDPVSGNLEIDADIYDANAGEWVRDVSARKKPKPSEQEAFEEFRRILSVNRDRRSGFVTVSVAHHSPTLARDWVDSLIEDLNMTIMQRDVEEAERSIAYLNEQIAGTSLADLQSVFFGLIEEQTKIVMLAKVSPEYAFKTIDPAVAPERRSKPNRVLIVALGLMGGGLLGVALLLAWNRIRRPSGSTG